MKMWVGLYIFFFIGLCVSGINFNRYNILMFFNNAYELKMVKIYFWVFVLEK